MIDDRCEFFSALKHECISEIDYLHAINNWNVFKGDYHDLYLKVYVLLLADGFEKLINTCLKFYGFEPCHYFSSPGISSDAMRDMTDIELELVSDIDMHLFVEKEMRGGISYIAERYSKANDKYKQSYDDKKLNKYITYLDVNNSYGWEIGSI